MAADAMASGLPEDNADALFSFFDNEYQTEAGRATVLKKLEDRIDDEKEKVDHILIYIHGYMGDRLASTYSSQFEALIENSALAQKFKEITKLFRKSEFLTRQQAISPIQQTVETFDKQRDSTAKALVIVYYWDCNSFPQTAQTNALESSKILISLLKDLHSNKKIMKQVDTIDIVAHSFGNYVLVNTLGIYKAVNVDYQTAFPKIRQLMSFQAAIETTFLRDNASKILFSEKKGSIKSWTFFWDPNDKVCLGWKIINSIRNDQMVGNNDIIKNKHEYFDSNVNQLNEDIVRTVDCSNLSYNIGGKYGAWFMFSRHHCIQHSAAKKLVLELLKNPETNTVKNQTPLTD